MNFGPINQDGGWRRLNVAVSRARKEMKVFSVIRPDQIDLSRTSAEGVAKLRAFLEFADRGTAGAQNTADSKPDAFAQTIAQALTERGYTVKCGVGSSGYRIDAAVVHPDDPNRFLLALLCSSRQNLDASTARDRCISQPSVLRGLGWQVCNVSILDWLDAPTRVIDKIEEAIRAALDAEQMPEPVIEEKPAVYSAEQFDHEEITVETEPAAPYVPCELGELGSPESFLLPMVQKNICAAITKVIEQEAPVSRRILQKRIFNAWGMSRSNQKAEAAFNKALATLMPSSTGEGDAEFFWRDDQIPSAYDGVRLGSGADKRPIEDICPEELCAGVMRTIRVLVSAPRTDVMKASAKLFGFVRMTPAVESAFSGAIQLAADRGLIKLEGEQVVLL